MECALGMFVGRWGLLRRALSPAMGLKKMVSLTLCLARLHTFCIEQRGSKLLTPLASDAMEALAHDGGGFVEGNCPEELLGGGDRDDDTTAVFRRNFGRNLILDDDVVLPRDKLLKLIEDSGFKRPCPKGWGAFSPLDA
jgi:hypothetical protein